MTVKHFVKNYAVVTSIDIIPVTSYRWQQQKP